MENHMENLSSDPGSSSAQSVSIDESEALSEEKVNMEQESLEDEKVTPASEEVASEKLMEEQEYRKKFYYLAAEFENFKKRSERERESTIKFGNERMLMDFIDVVDNLERTLSAIKDEEDTKVKNIMIGIKMVKTQFSEVLKKHGLVEVESVGKHFDPNLHEAISQRVVTDKEDDEILEEFQKGYLLNGRLLRPAKVIVSKTA